MSSANVAANAIDIVANANNFAFMCIPLDICNIISEYAVLQKMLDWIKFKKID